jgi:phosphoglycerate dehydrogenase-like enzyme
VDAARVDHAPRSVRVWIHSDDSDRPVLEEAVTEAGGTLARPEDAEVIVWASNEVLAIVPFLHEGIRWVQLWSAGVDAWLARGVIDGGREWTAAKGVYAGVIAEFSVAMLLAGACRLPETIPATTWRPLKADTLSGKSVGIVGAGGIGTELVRLLQPFQVRTLALTRTGRDVPLASESLDLTELDRLLRESDYVVLTAPATAESRGLLSRQRIALMRPNAWLVNVARGELVDTDALVEALVEGRIRGASLDVTDPEPLPDEHALWHLPNVVVAPHLSGSAPAWRQAFAERIQSNLARYVAGRPLIGLVDIDAGY